METNPHFFLTESSAFQYQAKAGAFNLDQEVVVGNFSWSQIFDSESQENFPNPNLKIQGGCPRHMLYTGTSVWFARVVIT